MQLMRLRRGVEALRGQRGASMIEVLVAIVIASVGLLALAGVNTASTRYTKMSQYRATATLLANDYAERMRANREGFMNGDYDLTSDFAAQATVPNLPSPLCNSGSFFCTASQIAAVDVAQWRRLVRSQLPNGAMYASREATQNAMDLWVVWRDPAVAATDEAPAIATECADGLNLGSDASVRCAYFRINL